MGGLYIGPYTSHFHPSLVRLGLALERWRGVRPATAAYGLYRLRVGGVLVWWATGAALSCSVWQLPMSSCNRVRRPLVPHAWHGSRVVTLPATARCELREQEEDVSYGCGPAVEETRTQAGHTGQRAIA